jgi:hypothetical protein
LNFRKFFGRNWKEVLSPFLAINEVPSTIKNESHGAKNKVIKPHRAKTYLTIYIYIYKFKNFKEKYKVDNFLHDLRIWHEPNIKLTIFFNHLQKRLCS